MAMIKTNPVFFPGEERERMEYKRISVQGLPESDSAKEMKRVKRKKKDLERPEKPYTPKKDAKYEYRHADVDIIISEVAEYFNFSPQQLTGKRRMRDLVIARHTAYHLIKKYLDITLDYLGFHFNDADHSSVIHGLTKVDDFISTDQLYVCKLYDLSLNIKNKISDIKPGAKEDITDQFNQEEAYVFYTI